eukprot:gb/GECH01014537.1/.p1 GENE.gb/GECH01014537.1/~~gb/GECH01014537.1/.p1  ORF type:complete len:624 (+),score=124.58 gb/GECH01014537.1/:1-1872(+)
MSRRSHTPPPDSRNHRSPELERRRSSTPPPRRETSQTSVDESMSPNITHEGERILPPSAQRYKAALKRAPLSRNSIDNSCLHQPKSPRSQCSSEDGENTRSFCGDFIEDNAEWIQFNNLSSREKNEMMETLTKAESFEVSYKKLPIGDYLVCYNPHSAESPNLKNSLSKSMTYGSISNHSQGSNNLSVQHFSPPSQEKSGTAQPVISQRTVSSYIHDDPQEENGPHQLIFDTLSGNGRKRSSIWLVRIIEDIYSSRLQTFRHEVSTSSGKFEEFPLFVQQYLSKKFGLDRIVRQSAEDLMRTIKEYQEKNQLVYTFGVFLFGSQYDQTDLLFYLLSRNIAMKETLRGSSKTQHIIPFRLLPNITRNILNSQPRKLFQSCMARARSIVSSARGKGVDMYEFLAMLLKEYKATRQMKDDDDESKFSIKNPLDIPVAYRIRKIDLWVLVILHPKPGTMENHLSPRRMSRNRHHRFNSTEGSAFDSYPSDMEEQIHSEEGFDESSGKTPDEWYDETKEGIDQSNSKNSNIKQSHLDQLVALQTKLHQKQNDDQFEENGFVSDDSKDRPNNNDSAPETPYLDDADEKTLEEHVDSLGNVEEIWDSSMLDQIKEKLRPMQNSGEISSSS